MRWWMFHKNNREDFRYDFLMSDLSGADDSWVMQLLSCSVAKSSPLCSEIFKIRIPSRFLRDMILSLLIYSSPLCVLHEVKGLCVL